MSLVRFIEPVESIVLEAEAVDMPKFARKEIQLASNELDNRKAISGLVHALSCGASFVQDQDDLSDISVGELDQALLAASDVREKSKRLIKLISSSRMIKQLRMTLQGKENINLYVH